MGGHQCKDTQNGSGITELCGGQNVDAALIEDKIGSGNRSPASAELLVEADRRGQMFHQQCGAAIDHAGMPVIGAHPVGGIGGTSGLQTNGSCGGLILRLPVERVVVAAMAEVQETSGGGQKIKGSFGIATC